MPVSHDLFPLAGTDPMEAGLGEVAGLFALFSQVADPRDTRGVRHALASVLTVLVLFRNLAIALIRLSGTSRITQTLQRIAADRSRILPLLAASIA